MNQTALEPSVTGQNSVKRIFSLQWRPSDPQETVLYLPLSDINNASEISSIACIDTSYAEIDSPPSLDQPDETPTNSMRRRVSNSISTRCSKKRVRIIIIGLIFLCTLLITVMVPTLLHYFNLDDTTTSSTIFPYVDTSNGTVTTVTTSSTQMIHEVGNGGASGDRPCTSHTVITDPTRNIATSELVGMCDNGPFFNTSFHGRWIRFDGPGGTTIPSIPPGPNHCGGSLTGWCNGTLPVAIKRAAKEIICFDTHEKICHIHVPISIVNCNGFYVYFLPPVPICNSRYCTV